MKIWRQTMSFLNDILGKDSFLSELEKAHVQLVFDSLKAEYKGFIEFDFMRRTMFDTKRQNRQVLLERLQHIILDIADKKAKEATLETNGKFISGYEAMVLKRKYFISEIIDTTNEKIKYFVASLQEKAMI